MRVGMQGRFFPGNWRPPADEIRFAAESGFAAVQIRSDRVGGIGEELRADLGETGRAFAESRVECVVEMLPDQALLQSLALLQEVSDT